MDARRSWAAPAGTRSAERPRYWYLETARTSWRILIAQLRRSAFADWILDSSQRRPALAGAAVGAQTSDLAITRRRYERGLQFLVAGQFDAATAPRLKHQCEWVDPEAVETVVLDLGDVTYMDASGLSVLLAAFAHLGERLSIIIGPPCAHTTHITKARDRLPIIEG
jgi:anti-sigma B factor antagonist